MTNQNVKILFTKSTTIRSSKMKISLAQNIIDTAKLENSDYFMKVTEALKNVPHKEIKIKTLSY